MTDAAKIARGLSKAQREAVLCAVNSMIPSHYKTAIRISSPTFQRLSRVGIIPIWPPRLTPLGLAVRAELERNSHD